MRAKRGFSQPRETTKIEADVFPVPGAYALGTATNPALALLTPCGNGLRVGTRIEIGDGHGHSSMFQPRAGEL